MDRRDRDPLLGDGVEVGVGLVVVGGVVAVDVVPAAPALVGLELEPVAVDAAPEPHHRDALRGRRRRVHVQDRPGRQAARADQLDQPGQEVGRGREVVARLAAEVHAGLLALLRDRDGGDAQHEALERRGDGARVGDVVAEVDAVVDARRRSGRAGRPARPSAAKRTQSTGVPSVAYPVEPSRSVTSTTVSGRSMVMPRPTALRFESGAITDTVPTESSARFAASRPREVMPSSLVIRMFMRAR